ncbi:MAG: hypothetical protein QOK47_1352 [Actinomycetota bacterium]|nr:hypothetical protein [Actinomycetota bacterium]
MNSRRGLQLFVVILGLVALIAGGLAMLFGAGLVPDSGAVSANVDSEMRFFATWYAVAGFVLLRAAPKVESQTTLIRTVAAAVFIAGCTRILSLIVVGKPDPLFLMLMAIELALPFVLVPWQSAVARRA